MTVRPPLTFATRQDIATGWDVLGHEVAQQKAQTLGTLSTQVEHALARLRAFDAGAPNSVLEPQRSALVNDAADRVWALMIQRELCGLRQWDAAVKEYGIPREVLNRVGQVKR
jgi:Family of unknown function (DUF6665)